MSVASTVNSGLPVYAFVQVPLSVAVLFGLKTSTSMLLV